MLLDGRIAVSRRWTILMKSSLEDEASVGLLCHDAVYVFTNPFSSDSCQLDDGATNMHKVGINPRQIT